MLPALLCLTIGLDAAPLDQLPIRSAMIAPAIWRDAQPDEIGEVHRGPDKKWLAYVLSESRENPEDWRRVSLCAIRADMKHARNLFVGGTGNDREAEFAKWAPDSRHVLYWNNVFGAMSVNADGNPLWDVDVVTGKRRQLSALTTHGSEEMALQEPQWIQFSPKGDRLLMVLGGSRLPYFSKRIREVNYQTLSGRWLTPKAQACVDPNWSPNAKQIAYAASPEVPSASDYWMNFHIWIVSADGSKRRRLTNDPKYGDRWPEWSRDGKRLRFERMDASSNSSRWEIGADGKGLRRFVIGK